MGVVHRVVCLLTHYYAAMQQWVKLDKSMKHHYFIVRHLVCVYSR